MTIGVLSIKRSNGTELECMLKTETLQNINVSISLFYTQGHYIPKKGDSYSVKCEDGKVTEILEQI